MNKLVRSRSIYWCESDDRYVLVVKDADKIVGLNFMQGDEYDLFLKDYNTIDHDLTKYYDAIWPYLSATTEIDMINQAIWGWFAYKNE